MHQGVEVLRVIELMPDPETLHQRGYEGAPILQSNCLMPGICYRHRGLIPRNGSHKTSRSTFYDVYWGDGRQNPESSVDARSNESRAGEEDQKHLHKMNLGCIHERRSISRESLHMR